MSKNITYKKLASLLFVVVLVVAVVLPSMSTSAQGTRNDTDGDGIINELDRCPNEPGTRQNNGCPDSQTRPDDRDGDGVLDFVDLCPDQPASGFSEGCPILPPQIEVPGIESVDLLFSTYESCRVIVPMNSESVNVRDFPSPAASVMRWIGPGFEWEPDGIGNASPDVEADVLITPDSFYYRLPNAVDEIAGWVHNSTVVDNGMCDDLPALAGEFICLIHVPVDSPTSVALGYSPTNLTAGDMEKGTYYPVTMRASVGRSNWYVIEFRSFYGSASGYIETNNLLVAPVGRPVIESAACADLETITPEDSQYQFLFN